MAVTREWQSAGPTLIRLAGTLAGASLLAAASVLPFEARALNHPLQHVPAILITGAAGVGVFLGVGAAMENRRRLAMVIFGLAVFFSLFLSLGRFIPPIYRGVYLVDWEGLFPPAWPYTLALPLLLLLLAELSIPTIRGNGGSTLSLVGGTAAAIMQLFFTVALLSIVASESELFLLPGRLFLAYLAAFGACGSLVLGTVLVRKGVPLWGGAILLAVGFVLVAGSTTLYAGPDFVFSLPPRASGYFPTLPMLAGTIPGIMVVVVWTTLLWRDNYS
ncbi:MAG: hypothetical protein HYY00_01960 [Chloroflexi bacterium]|nr:hypothetical protein [Chloroflexota bacterium]